MVLKKVTQANPLPSDVFYNEVTKMVTGTDGEEHEVIDERASKQISKAFILQQVKYWTGLKTEMEALETEE